MDWKRGLYRGLEGCKLRCPKPKCMDLCPESSERDIEACSVVTLEGRESMVQGSGVRGNTLNYTGMQQTSVTSLISHVSANPGTHTFIVVPHKLAANLDHRDWYNAQANSEASKWPFKRLLPVLRQFVSFVYESITTSRLTSLHPLLRGDDFWNPCISACSFVSASQNRELQRTNSPERCPDHEMD